jgi:hypothetical protein
MFNYSVTIRKNGPYSKDHESSKKIMVGIFFSTLVVAIALPEREDTLINPFHLPSKKKWILNMRSIQAT